MYDGGADVVFAAAGGSGTGVFQAAKAAQQAGHRRRLRPVPDAPTPAVRDVIITSMLKRVDVAVCAFLTDAQEGDLKAGEERFDLAADGVGYSTSGGKVDDIKAQLDELKKQIIDGTIKVPTTVLTSSRRIGPDPGCAR